jgi:hypothetical protein
MRFLRNVSHFTFNVSRIAGNEWEFCNGYAIVKYLHVSVALAITAQLACEYDGL